MSASKELFMQLRQDDEVANYQQGISFEHLLDAKKDNIRNAVQTIFDAVQAGEADSLKSLLLAVKGKALFTDLEKAIRPLAEKHNVYKIEKNYSAFDCNIDVADSAVSYDYSTCNDPEWQYLSERKAFFEKELKERESFLKSLKNDMDVIVQGEPVTIKPPTKSSKTGLKITIK